MMRAAHEGNYPPQLVSGDSMATVELGLIAQAVEEGPLASPSSGDRIARGKHVLASTTEHLRRTLGQAILAASAISTSARNV